MKKAKIIYSLFLILSLNFLTGCSKRQKTVFDNLTSFKVTSKNLHRGVWDTKISNTEKGSNTSPELTWKSVDNATQYAVFMIDGAWIHMDVFTDKTNLEEGIVKDKPRGFQYVGPYPPEGTHTYTVYVFALKNEPGKVKFMFNSGGNSIDLIYKDLDKDSDGNAGNVIAYGKLSGTYTH